MSALERIYALAFEFGADGAVDLEQDTGCGEVERITLHPSQLRLLAARAGLLSQTSPPSSNGIERMLLRVHSDLHYLTNEDCGWMDEICERLGEGLAFKVVLVAVTEVIDDILEDLGYPVGVTSNEKPGDSCANSHSISVTPSPVSVTSATSGKPGRPRKPDAMTPAERQAKHREKGKQEALEFAGGEEVKTP